LVCFFCQGGDRGERKGPAALRRRKRVEDDGLLARLQAAAEKPLQNAKYDQLAQAFRNAAQKRARGERDDANYEVALASEQPGEESRDGQHDAVGDEV
jgi:hypothetical protein